MTTEVLKLKKRKSSWYIKRDIRVAVVLLGCTFTHVRNAVRTWILHYTL